MVFVKGRVGARADYPSWRAFSLKCVLPSAAPFSWAGEAGTVDEWAALARTEVEGLVVLAVFGLSLSEKGPGRGIRSFNTCSVAVVCLQIRDEAPRFWRISLTMKLDDLGVWNSAGCLVW